MRIRLTPTRSKLLLALLSPIAAMHRAVRAIRRQEPNVLRSTIEGDPLAHTGHNPILIVVWADWAAVWNVATKEIVARLQREFAGRCEFAFVEAVGRAVRDAYDAPVVPTLILRKQGAEIGRFVNVLKAGEIRSAIAAAVSTDHGPGASIRRNSKLT